MSQFENNENNFTFALNERRAQLDIQFNPDSDPSDLYTGSAQIKVYPDTIYYHWTIFHSFTIHEGSLSVKDIPENDDVWGYIQFLIIEQINNYQVQEKAQYLVTKWVWEATTLDIKPVENVIKLLENVKWRPGMFLKEPSEITSFLIGVRLAYSTLGFHQDEAVITEARYDLGINPSDSDAQEVTAVSWKDVDTFLTLEITAWKKTYDL